MFSTLSVVLSNEQRQFKGLATLPVDVAQFDFEITPSSRRSECRHVLLTTVCAYVATCVSVCHLKSRYGRHYGGSRVFCMYLAPAGGLALLSLAVCQIGLSLYSCYLICNISSQANSLQPY